MYGSGNEIDFSFYDTHWRPLPEAHAAQVYQSTSNYYDKEDRVFWDGLARLTREKPDFFVEKEQRAREFYTRLGFTSLSEIYLVDEDTKIDPFKLEGSETIIAQHYGRYNTILARKKRIDQLPQFIDSALTHELFHDTALPKPYHCYTIYDADTGRPTFRSRAGFVLNTKHGAFYEEGVATYMGALYARTLKGDSRPIGITHAPGPEIPEYMQPPDAEMTSGPDGYAIELIGHFAVESGRMSGHAYQGLLLDTRREQTQTAALRTFAHLVDSIEPGLYPRLRRLKYGKESWQEGLESVYTGVTKALENPTSAR